MTTRARAENLLSWCQQIAATDGMGFRIRQSGSSLIFETYMPRDRRDGAVFSRDVGNVASLAMPHQAATVNYVYVGGSGEGTARLIAERGDPESIAKYGRREIFIDRRNAQTATDLGQAIADQLESSKGGSGAEFEVLETDAVQFGRDYDLGDLVSIVGNGRVIYGYVTEVHIRMDRRGVSIQPKITAAAVAPLPPGRVAMTTVLQQISASYEGYTIGMQMRWTRPIAQKPSGWQWADGTNGTTDTRGLYGKGASSDGEVGDTGGAASVDLTHSHTGAPHTHAHDHDGAPHTHAHDHDGAPHTHAHAHDGAPHVHNTDLDHNHPSVNTGPVRLPADLNTNKIINVDDTADEYADDHDHSVDFPALGATLAVSTDAYYSGQTGSDSSAASFSGQTGSDSSAASFSGQTGSDSSAASFSGETSQELTSVNLDPPHVKIYYLERVS